MPFINEVVSQNKDQLEASKIAATKSITRFLFDPDHVSAVLRSRIVGQAAMQQAIADQLHLIKSEIANPIGPLSVCLLMGPTGVGKTETVRILAEAILGSADQLCRIDMNTLSQAHYSSAITGAPPGYVGSKENHSLLQAEKIEGSYSRPGIVLFDEIEKASQEVLRSLLNIMDSGVLHLPSGTKEISFRNTMVFMTSNVGAKEFAYHQQKRMTRWGARFARKWSKRKSAHFAKKALEGKFDPEFLNRIDQTICFERIPTEQVLALVHIEMQKLNNRLRKHKTTLRLHASAEQFLVSSYQNQYGARDIIRNLRTHVEPAMARVLNETVKPEQNYLAKFIHGKIEIQVS
jgi:ATP-dependent Clp protease ATP-binding subunit ClpA